MSDQNLTAVVIVAFAALLAGITFLRIFAIQRQHETQLWDVAREAVDLRRGYLESKQHGRQSETDEGPIDV